MSAILKTRMNRATYWAIFVPVVVLYGLLLTFAEHPPGIAEGIIIVLGVPRLHDLGASGWWMAAPIGIEIAALVGAAILLPIGDILIVAGVIVLGMTVMMIVLGLIPGQPGANAYGEPPASGVAFIPKPKAG